MRSARLVHVLLLPLLSACGFAAPLDEERTAEIAAEAEAAHNAMLDAARRVDAGAIAALLADEGRFSFDGTSMSNGEARAFTRQAYEGLRSQELKVDHQEVTVLAPDVAVVSGAGEVAATDSSGVEGPWVDVVWTFVWKKGADGTWRVVDSHQSTQTPTP